jgi:hypothetical protein
MRHFFFKKSKTPSESLLNEINDQDLTAPLGGVIDHDESESLLKTTSHVAAAMAVDNLTLKYGCSGVLTVGYKCEL